MRFLSLSRAGGVALVFFAVLAFSAFSKVSRYETVEGVVHEAYLAPIKETVLLEAVSVAIPERIQEGIPERVQLGAVWIPGYWGWEKEKQNFIWISGVWRKPPQGYKWESGFWHPLREGSVWISGYWKKEGQPESEGIEKIPPEPVEEEITQSPGDGYFWIHGHWAFDHEANQYTWLSGQWQKLDANLLYVPPQYRWTPKGYVFISDYWDWPLEKRGTAYKSVFIPANQRTTASYKPAETIDPLITVRHYFFSYPDYRYFFEHHFAFHADFWNNFGLQPPWWNSKSWWAFTWKDQWALWWWWSHSHYPAPSWITKELTREIAPPPSPLYRLMLYVEPPVIVTSQGVTSPRLLLKKAKKMRFSRGSKPVLPGNIHEVAEIQLATASTHRGNQKIRPSGSRAEIPAHLPVPKIAALKKSGEESGLVAKIAEKPNLSKSTVAASSLISGTDLLTTVLEPIAQTRLSVVESAASIKEPVKEKKPTRVITQSDGRYNRPRPGYKPTPNYYPPNVQRTTPTPRHPVGRDYELPESPVVPSTFDTKIDTPLERQKERIEPPSFRLEGESRFHQNQSTVKPLPEKKREGAKKGAK